LFNLIQIINQPSEITHAYFWGCQNGQKGVILD
jgi:hypothetical protein